ncbi:hypothetical protein FB548_2043 [Pseudoxanthomonas sp. 3HH-4]|uniref:hypothetical protein n=1 Tax=Pseudoxanthomonas sp. 3HH-4 TaxID=1690214 RepID=UPI001153C041|nr:hypothetical protein [Pseudoxanthomonas sp. 3HH-4]TQM12118.1 hypothetical protein FB548_2043 [Pseudoxanthomonas sp. 3HH-4]
MDRSSINSALFERGGLRTAFEHARNAVVATLIIAAGLEASKGANAIGVLGISPLVAGYLVAAVGYVLILLNCIDGLRRLSRLRWHVIPQVALSLAYLLVSIRIVELTILLRTGAC